MRKFIALFSAAMLLVTPLTVSASCCGSTSPSAKAVVAAATTTTSSTDSTSAVEAAASAENKSVAEYVNNAVVSTPGLPTADTKPVAQGGKIFVNGVATNMTVTLGKVNAATVKSAKAAVEGTIVNIVNAKLPVAKGNTVTVNFYVKGLAGTENMTAYQLIDGVWTQITIKELRLDHIVLDLTQSGPVMFVQN